MSDLITHLGLANLRDILQQAGFRAEQLTDPIAKIEFLRSSTGGVGFDVRLGNPGADGGVTDAVFIAAFQLQGELPFAVVNGWNATRRFARLQLGPQLLAISLDVSVMGGVSPRHLRAKLEIWDQLVQDLIGYLRNELRNLPAVSDQAPRPGALAAASLAAAAVH